MARGVSAAFMALAAVVVLACALDAVSAVPTARRIRSKTLQARSHRSQAATHAHASAHARVSQFACRQQFIAKDNNNPLKQDQKFLSFCPASDKPVCEKKEEFTWQKAVANANQRSRMGMKRMIEWQSSYVQSSFKYLIISASKAMSGWSKEEVAWYKQQNKDDVDAVVPDVAKGKGWPNKALIGAPKSMNSAWRKVSDQGDEGYKYDFTRLVDAIRASFVFENAAHVEQAVCYFREWLAADAIAKKHKCAVVQDKDRWTVPIAGGYSDFMLNMKCTWGDAESGARDVIVELQFHSCAVLMVKQGDVGAIKNMFKDLANPPLSFANIDKNGHKLYEEARKLVAPNPQIAVLNTRMGDLYAQALALPAGKCDIENAPKFHWEEGEEAEYEVYDLGKEVAAGKKWLHSKDYHSINWNVPNE